MFFKKKITTNTKVMTWSMIIPTMMQTIINLMYSQINAPILVDKSLPGCSSTPVPTKSLKNCSLKNFSCDSGVKLDDSATPMPVNTLSNSSKNSSCNFGENLSVSTAHTSTEALKKPVPDVEEDKTVLTSGNELIDKDENTGQPGVVVEDGLLKKRKRKNKKKKNHAK